ncbi:hypothetical protein B0T21DRAFT_417558 [Apiosordaria backusii]|uniref:N-acetyltransferase domain-containing protein n=1 Tax=Apiosordaria backusii TaxID=314023 RepID=A0AA40EXL2_9PEZI|nr:hypothetical protein B0T21DRAFT_417558 [Apiosordaria backusii]
MIHPCCKVACAELKPPVLSDMLNDGDIVLLLTPAIVLKASPLNRASNCPPSDPFEPLGKALASTHETHVALAAAVIFVISGPPRHGQPSQVTLAERVRALYESRPLVILTCCDVRELGPLATPFPTPFPTPIKVLSLDPLDLEAAAACILFGEPRNSSLRRPGEHNLIPSRQPWSRRCLPKMFHLSRDQFETLLCRDGYAMHYVVREAEISQVLGFCATYTTYVDGSDCLLGSLAALLVQPSHQRRGIGRSLHDHALRQLTRIRGVSRLQLGSTFPRLLYGPPITDFDAVLDFIDGVSKSNGHMGWYDQYARLANSENVQDIILGLKGETIIVAALTYDTENDVPRDSVMIRLFDTCIRVLKDAKTNRLFIDGIKGGDDGFSELGFRKWARYIEVWRECRDSGAVTGDKDD